MASIKCSRHIDGLRNSKQIVISSLIAVFDQPNNIAFFKGFGCRSSPFLPVIQRWQILFTESASNEI